MLGVNMKFITVVIPLTFLSAIIDATPVDKPGAHARDRFFPMRPKANLQERGNNPTNDDASKICDSYDINEDGFVVAEEIWASEAYGDPTHSIGNAKIWVTASDEDKDGQLNEMECLKFVMELKHKRRQNLKLKQNQDRTTLCHIMDVNNDKTISSEELINTPDAVLTLLLPFNAHIVDEAEADFAINLHDDKILGGNQNGIMELAECKTFFGDENVPRALCKLIALSGKDEDDNDNLISTSELQDHFEMMEHHEVPKDLAQFVVSTFDKETLKGNGDGNMDETECVNFFKYEHEGHNLH